jgi:hypothetical protein
MTPIAQRMPMLNNAARMSKTMPRTIKLLPP